MLNYAPRTILCELGGKTARVYKELLLKKRNAFKAYRT